MLPTDGKNEIPRLSQPQVLDGHDLLVNRAARFEGKKLLLRDVIPDILVLTPHLDRREPVLIRVRHVRVHLPRGATRVCERLVSTDKASDGAVD